ncbi:MAG TPA: glycine dehydrogenase (aminomethyl-transferring), partial [Gemmatimonadales bacterium]|nr:glycine dehydrogenase (aminomethyl-transferring) [Gemmatimonadales bacterium]
MNDHPDRFVSRHNGPRPDQIRAMLEAVGYRSLDTLIDDLVPPDIRLRQPLNLPAARSETAALARLRELAASNRLCRSYLGMGYSDCITPGVILRNVLENPGWYTAYTPYQAEIAQGRLEALLNFQTMVADLTALEISGASLLDEATAAAEAMAMSVAVAPHAERPVYLVDEACHPQTIAVVRTRAEARAVDVAVGKPSEVRVKAGVIGALVQYPATDGALGDYRALCQAAHAAGALVTAATDLLALTLLTPPGEWGADIAVGNSQRLGVPLGYGGPHAAFFATRETHKRHIPGRIIGVSRDSAGRPALRMALQTREQHIRREKATSNICTAQVLLAVTAGMYAVYHGPERIAAIAQRVHRFTALLAAGLRKLGYTVQHPEFFDTIAVQGPPDQLKRVHQAAQDRRINLRALDQRRIGVALDETTGPDDLRDLLEVFALGKAPPALAELEKQDLRAIPQALARTTPFLTHPVFHSYHSETEMLRYLKRLEDRDLSLTSAMIPL